jgi:FixJ family two-component response regulator
MSESTVYVVDCDPEEANSLRGLLSATPWRLKTFTSPDEFFTGLDHNGPACLVLDLETPHADGRPIQDVLKARGVELATLILTGCNDVPTVVQAMQRGAFDLLQKPVPRQELIRRVEEALERDRQRIEVQAAKDQTTARWALLTAGERAVARMLIDGKSSREIGARLGLGRRTIENRRANIMLKMRAESLASLVRIICCVGHDFPPPEPSVDSATKAEESPPGE